MKKIINGKKYDTDTAKMVAYACSTLGATDFAYWEETLFRKQTGEYFIYGYGGPMTKWAETISQNCWGWGKGIAPLTVKQAMKWAENHVTADEYERIFGEVEE